MDDKQKFIALAQDKKNISIAFFNASNLAVELFATLPAALRKKDKMLPFIREMRSEFLNDYTDFHKTVISQVGKPSDEKEVAEAVASIEACTSFAELKKLWVDVFTESLRSNDKVAAAKDAKKKSYAAN